LVPEYFRENRTELLDDNSFTHFVEEKCVLNKTSWIPFMEFKKAFHDWCVEQRIQQIPTFNRAIYEGFFKKNGIEVTKKGSFKGSWPAPGFADNPPRMRSGVAFKGINLKAYEPQTDQ
jgi:hypothetical protein